MQSQFVFDLACFFISPCVSLIVGGHLSADLNSRIFSSYLNLSSPLLQIYRTESFPASLTDAPLRHRCIFLHGRIAQRVECRSKVKDVTHDDTFFVFFPNKKSRSKCHGVFSGTKRVSVLVIIVFGSLSAVVQCIKIIKRASKGARFSDTSLLHTSQVLHDEGRPLTLSPLLPVQVLETTAREMHYHRVCFSTSLPFFVCRCV